MLFLAMGIQMMTWPWSACARHAFVPVARQLYQKGILLYNSHGEGPFFGAPRNKTRHGDTGAMATMARLGVAPGRISVKKIRSVQKRKSLPFNCTYFFSFKCTYMELTSSSKCTYAEAAGLAPCKSGTHGKLRPWSRMMCAFCV